MTPWWERWPGRLDYELEALRAAGARCEVDEAAKTNGKIVLAVEYPFDGQDLHLQVHFPDSYPKTRFEALAPHLTLRRHFNPFGKNLCLLGRATRNWDPDLTVARVLAEQLPKVIKIGTAADPLRFKDEEEPQGEPITDLYPYATDAAILVDTAWVLDEEVKEGDLEVALGTTKFPFRGAVLRILGGGRALGVAEEAIGRLYADKRRIKGRWVRMSEPILESDPEAYLRKLADHFPKLKKKRVTVGKDIPPDIIGIVFPEEIQQGKYADAWVFLVRPDGPRCRLVRSCRAGQEDLRGRSPELRPLAGKRVSVIGLGSLGAASAIELARAGVGELLIADFDFVEAGTVSRWPLGLTAAGRKKTSVLRGFISANYPHTRVTVFSGAIGAAMHSEEYSDLRDLEKLIDVDLVFDATTEVGVQQILSDEARAHEKPYICISATAGAWGGVIARVMPGKPGCWMCFQHELDTKRIAPAPMKVDGTVQVPGCGSPTFTGAGFDCSEVALAGVRLAAGTLCRGVEGGYPDVAWDIAVLEMRTADGAAIAPRWTTYGLSQSGKCRTCR